MASYHQLILFLKYLHLLRTNQKLQVRLDYPLIFLQKKPRLAHNFFL